MRPHRIRPDAAIASAHALATKPACRCCAKAATLSTRRSRLRRRCRWWSRSAAGSAAAVSSCCTTPRPARTCSSTRARPHRRRPLPPNTCWKNGDFDRDRAENGPWSAGIPGLPAAFVHLADKYGKLPLKTTLAPAIKLARDGFPIYARLVRGYASRRAVMERYPGTRAVFLAGGAPLKEGEIFKPARTGEHAGNASRERLRWFLPRRNRQASCWRGVNADRRALDGEGTGRLSRQRARADQLRVSRLAHHHRAAAVLRRHRARRNAADTRGLGSAEARSSASHPSGGRGDAPRVSAIAPSISAIRIS